MTVIEWYFQAEGDALIDCFTDDARIIDDGHTYEGRDEIREWRDEVASAFDYTTEVLSIERLADERYRVLANVEGDFPGGQVELAYDFTLRGDRIRELVISA